MRPVLTAVLAAALFVPATAGASTAALSGGNLTLTGAGTENNDFLVDVEFSTINNALTGVYVTDAGVQNMTPSTSCLPSGPNKLYCRSTSFNRITANLGAGNDVLRRPTEIQFIPQTVNAGAGDDTIFGSKTLDFFIPGAGADTIVGGGSKDVLDLRTETGPVVADAATGSVTHAGSTDTVSGIYHLASGGGNDDISGFPLIWGGNGNDTLTADPLGGRVLGQGGNDALFGQDGDDLLDGGLGADTFDGRGGNDLVEYAGRPEDLRLQVNNLADDGAPGEGDNILSAETLRSSYGNDYLKGGGGVKTLDGGKGRDRLLGGTAAETLLGGDNDDQLSGGPGADILDCGSGTKDEYVNDASDTLIGCEIFFVKP